MTQASIGNAISLLLRFRCSSKAVPNAGFSVHESFRKTKKFTTSTNWKYHSPAEGASICDSLSQTTVNTTSRCQVPFKLSFPSFFFLYCFWKRQMNQVGENWEILLMAHMLGNQVCLLHVCSQENITTTIYSTQAPDFQEQMRMKTIKSL